MFDLNSHFSGSIFYERRRVFWIEVGIPSIDGATIDIIAKERARLLSEAKAGKGGIVDGDEVRVLRAAARFAAVVAGEISEDEIMEGEGGVREKEPAKVLPFIK